VARRLFLRAAVVIPLSIWAACPHPVLADDPPVRVVDVDAGPYPLRIGLYADPVRAGIDLPFGIEWGLFVSGPLTFAVEAVPAPGRETASVRGRVESSPEPLPGPAGVPGNIRLPTAGTWQLEVTVDGPEGRGKASVPVEVLPPPVIPVWLAWAIGLLPVYGFLSFMLTQWWRLRRRMELSSLI
jgi:hypothetical protein